MFGYVAVALVVFLFGYVMLFVTDEFDEEKYLYLYLIAAAVAWPLTLIGVLCGAIYVNYQQGLDKRKPL